MLYQYASPVTPERVSKRFARCASFQVRKQTLSPALHWSPNRLYFSSSSLLPFFKCLWVVRSTRSCQNVRLGDLTICLVSAVATSTWPLTVATVTGLPQYTFLGFNAILLSKNARRRIHNTWLYPGRSEPDTWSKITVMWCCSIQTPIRWTL